MNAVALPCLFFSLVFSLPVSFYCRGGTYETSFGVDRRLSVSLSRYGRRICSSTSESVYPSLPSAPSSEILSRCRQSGSLLLSRVSQKSPTSVPLRSRGRRRLRELLYEFRHARRRDALPAGAAFVFVAQGPVAPSFLKQYNLRNLVGDEHTLSPLLLSFLLPSLPSGRVGL